MALSSRIISNMPDKELALTNCVYVSDEDDHIFSMNRIIINGFVFNVRKDPRINNATIAMNSVQRKITRYTLGNVIEIEAYNPSILPRPISKLHCRLARITEQPYEETEEMYEYLQRYIVMGFNDQVFSFGQQVVYTFNDMNMRFIITGMYDKNNKQIQIGYVSHENDIIVSK